MKNKLFLIFLSPILLCSCFSNNLDGEISVVDMIGRKVNVNPGTYKNVVCIGAGALRVYSYIGDCNLLSGVEDIDNINASNRPQIFDQTARPYFIANQDVFSSKKSCGKGGPQAQKVEKEKILSCNPDIIISQYEDIEQMNELQNLTKVPVITIDYGNKVIFDEKVKDSFSLLGKIFNKENRAKELNDYIASQQEIIKQVTDLIPSEERPNVYVCGLGNWNTTNHLYTCENYYPFEIANVNNVCKNLPFTGIGPITKEKFISMSENMDKIIFDASAVKNIKNLNDEDKQIIKNAKAWKNNELYLQLPYNAYYTNLELTLANTWAYAKWFYPQKFESLNLNEKLDEITTKFLGKPLCSQIYSYEESYGGFQKITNTFDIFNF